MEVGKLREWNFERLFFWKGGYSADRCEQMVSFFLFRPKSLHSALPSWFIGQFRLAHVDFFLLAIIFPRDFTTVGRSLSAFFSILWADPKRPPPTPFFACRLFYSREIVTVWQPSTSCALNEVCNERASGSARLSSNLGDSSPHSSVIGLFSPFFSSPVVLRLRSNLNLKPKFFPFF